MSASGETRTNLEPAALGTIGILSLLAIWQLIASLSSIPPYFFPSPADVA